MVWSWEAPSEWRGCLFPSAQFGGGDFCTVSQRSAKAGLEIPRMPRVPTCPAQPLFLLRTASRRRSMRKHGSWEKKPPSPASVSTFPPRLSHVRRGKQHRIVHLADTAEGMFFRAECVWSSCWRENRRKAVSHTACRVFEVEPREHILVNHQQGVAAPLLARSDQLVFPLHPVSQSQQTVETPKRSFTTGRPECGALTLCVQANLIHPSCESRFLRRESVETEQTKSEAFLEKSTFFSYTQFFYLVRSQQVTQEC